MATVVQASSPTTTDTVNNPRRSLTALQSVKSQKNVKKKNKDTASNKRTRESWNYTQTAKLIKLRKENINLIESSRCNEVWFTIRK